MPITIGKKQESSFENPLGLLSDCHRRIETFLGYLQTVTGLAAGRELQSDEREALDAAITYFERAAPQHTLDEEESLFPRLLNSGNARAQEAGDLLESLHADHVTADELHAQVDALVRQWLDSSELSAEAGGQLKESLDALASIYQRHIAAEDNQLFPLAAAILEKQDHNTIGREMAERRGVIPTTDSLR
jgi:hemerythrin-like domain-containing protein